MNTDILKNRSESNGNTKHGEADRLILVPFGSDTIIAITREIMADVERHFPDHPGSLDRFDWPVTPDQATGALEDFVVNRASFGA